MKTRKVNNQKLSDPEKVGVLAGSLLFVIKGLRQGSITCKPIMRMPKGAKEWNMSSLEDEIWEALGKCGITEKKPLDVEPDKDEVPAFRNPNHP